MNKRDVMVGVALGGALAFMADPDRGRRRRALARDQVVRASRKTRDAMDATARDIANRAKGIAAATRGRFAHNQVDDDRLVERLRAKLGRVCSHPRAIELEVRDGEVTLRGPILSSEVAGVVSTVEELRGVRAVNDQLDRHETAEGIPSLQGDRSVPGQRLDMFQRHWAPATQALVFAGLAATGLYAAVHARR